jgi:hypothetical protein
MKPDTTELLFPELADDLSALDVMIVHEDNFTGVRAQHLFNRIMHYLHVSPRLEARFWKFNLLRNRTLMRSAAQAARFSDIVILSTHARQNLPAEAHAWIREWLRIRPDRPCSLVALLDAGETVAELPLIAELREMLDEASVDFFYSLFQPPPRELNLAPLIGFQNLAKSRTALRN